MNIDYLGPSLGNLHIIFGNPALFIISSINGPFSLAMLDFWRYVLLISRNVDLPIPRGPGWLHSRNEVNDCQTHPGREPFPSGTRLCSNSQWGRRGSLWLAGRQLRNLGFSEDTVFFVNLLYVPLFSLWIGSFTGEIGTFLYGTMAPYGPFPCRCSGNGKFNGSIQHGFRWGSGLGWCIHADHLRPWSRSECVATLLPAVPAGPAEQFIFCSWSQENSAQSLEDLEGAPGK